jgi:sulfonate transport system permease protein
VSTIAPAAPRARSGPSRAARLGNWMLDAKWPVSTLFVVIVLAIWEYAATRPGAAAWAIGPVAIVRTLFSDFGTYFGDSLASLGRMVPGYIIGAGLGIVLGILAGVGRKSEDFIDPAVGLTYSIPKIALYPGIALILGFSDRSRIFMVALLAFYPAYINAFAGTRSVNPQLLRVAANCGASRLRTNFAVVLPATLPRILVGVRISIALSWIILFAVEAIGGTGRGLGMTITFAMGGAQYAQAYAAVLCYALLGILTDRAVQYGGRRLTRGQELEARGRG